MMTYTLLNGDRLHVDKIDGYRKPNEALGDNPEATTMIHVLGSWYGVKEEINGR